MNHPAEGILAIGATMVDIVCAVDRLPASGEGVVPTRVRTTAGGCALNSAATAKRLGASVTLFSPIGQGPFSAMMREALQALGISGFEVPDTPYDSGGCVCLVEPSGQRTMITLPGIERHYCREWFAHLDEATCARLACGIACGYEVESAGGDAIVAFFEEHPAIQLFYAPGPRVCAVAPEKVARINALRPVWHLNDQEALAYTGCATLEEAGCALAKQCANVAVVTAGAEGSYAFLWDDAAQAATTLHVPTKPITPVDTIGAGDAHLGALAACWAQGASWEEALEAANQASAQVCAVEGALLPV